jgi:tetratricopeptide (TPR) repeat protein
LLRSGADGATIPGTIQSVVLARLDGLPPPDKAALQAASVLGLRFDLAALRHLLQDAGYDCATLQARDLVKREAADAGRWMFGHALIRDGAYASVLHSGRRALHLRAADWYAAKDATLHAEHLDRADDPRAGEAYLAAAQAEAAALRVDSALRLLRRGAELDAPPPVRHALAQLEGDLCRDIGDAVNAIAAFERALPLAGNDAQTCAAWIGIAAGHRVTSAVEPAFAALDRAQAVAERSGLDRERSRIHYLRGNLYFAQGNGVACRAEHERALAFAQASGDPECEAQALSGLGDANYANGTMRAAHAAFLRCVEICDQHGLARFAIMNQAMLAIIDTWLGNGDAALQRLARTRVTARELRHRLAEAMNEEVTGWMLISHGRFDEAHVHLTLGLALSREIGARRYELTCLMLLARIDWHRGNVDEARAQLDEAWAISAQTSHGFIGAALQGVKALVAEGDDARRRALATGEALLREYSIAHCHIWFSRDAIQASLDSGAWSEAERYAAALEEFTRREPLPWTDFAVAVARALAAAGRGNPDRAALLACRDEALALQDTVFMPALEAALARAP